MGMFDSTYDAADNEWQTKAFGCTLAGWRIGDAIDEHHPHPAYQVKVFGGAPATEHGDRDGLATIRDGVLVDVPSERDERLPLVDYFGGTIRDPLPTSTERSET